MKNKQSYLIRMFLAMSVLFFIISEVTNLPALRIPALVMVVLAIGFFIKGNSAGESERRLEDRLRNTE